MEPTDVISFPSERVKGEEVGPSMETCVHFDAFSGRSQLECSLHFLVQFGILRVSCNQFDVTGSKQNLARQDVRQVVDDFQKQEEPVLTGTLQHALGICGCVRVSQACQQPLE